MHFPVSRRGLLTAGVGGLSLGLLTACGLRLDQDPEIPTLDATQQLRNRLARILDSASPGAGDPETAGEDLADFAAAVGRATGGSRSVSLGDGGCPSAMPGAPRRWRGIR